MKSELAQYIDHTLLRPGATAADVETLCDEALRYGMAAVCIFPIHVAVARRALRNTNIAIAAVIAFPFGETFPTIKAAELRACAAEGANEVDCVLDIGSIKSGNLAAVEDEMSQLSETARALGLRSKLIIETGCLTGDEKIRVCEAANRARPDYVKTSTGFAPGGAKKEDVQLMRTHLLPEIAIKASGGIRSRDQAWQMLEAGASRIGTSAGIRIVEEAGH